MPRILRRSMKPVSLSGLVLVMIILLTVHSCGVSEDSETVQLHVFDFASAKDMKQFFRYHEEGPPLINTHRGGAKANFPENAIETFENTLKYTWSNMEVDPRYTKDSVIVLFHDATLDRTSTGSGSVNNYTYEELKQFSLTDIHGMDTDYTIPTLDEALDWAKGKTVLFLDNKDVDVIERAKSIQKHEAHAWAVIMAYSFTDAQRVYEFDPEIMMQVFLPDSKAIEQFVETGIPWNNIVGFVSHQPPQEPEIFDLIGERGAMGILGTSRTIDRAYLNGDIERDELLQRYQEVVDSGVHIVEPDLGIEAGEALESKRASASAKQHYFQFKEVPKF